MPHDFADLYERLRAIMLEAAPSMTISRDEPGALELRTPRIDPKTKQPGWFGTVTSGKSYVAFHLVPLYTNATLADDITPALAKRRQGKTCFNFKRADDTLFDELRQLARRCASIVDAQT